MGCFPRRRSSSSSFTCVRVVHVSGYIEDFEEPITVRQVVGKPPKHFLCSAAHLLSFGTQPLGSDVRLQPGRLYFLLPHTIFQSDSSPLDLASLAGRLTAIAKRGGPAGGGSAPSTPSRGLSPARGSPARWRHSTGSGAGLLWKRGKGAEKEKSGSGSYEAQMSCRVSSWKPILEAIEERSIERRCE